MSVFKPAPLIPYWEKAIRDGRVKPLSELDFSKYKSSDTVFLLGSGPSVNEMTLRDWQLVRECDSIGMNMWMAHPFVPTIYESEAPYESMELYCLWRERAAEYSRVPFIVFDCQTAHIDLDQVPRSLVDNMHVARTHFIQGDGITKASYASNLSKMVADGFFEPSSRIGVLARRRTSGVLNLVLAIKMGYRNIVLVGYDMRNDDYFHVVDNMRKPHMQYANEDPAGGVPVSIIIEAIIEAVTQPLGINVMVSSQSTKLYPYLRVWER